MYRYIELDKALSNKKTIQQSFPKGVQSKLFRLVNDILTNPRNKFAVGKPEELKYTDTEKWSRELTKKDRIVYSIEPGVLHNMSDVDEVVVFHQYLGHYGDK